MRWACYAIPHPACVASSTRCGQACRTLKGPGSRQVGITCLPGASPFKVFSKALHCLRAAPCLRKHYRKTKHWQHGNTGQLIQHGRNMGATSGGGAAEAPVPSRLRVG